MRISDWSSDVCSSDLAALSQQDACANGLTTISAGNHAIATAFAAREVGATAKAVMAGSPAPFRLDKARSSGAELLFAESGADAVSMAEAIAERESRLLVHPFDRSEEHQSELQTLMRNSY